MVERLAEMDAVFHALSHTARRETPGRLAARERTVGVLAAPFQMSLAAASKHVKVLEEAGLLHRAVRDGATSAGSPPRGWPGPATGSASTSGSGTTAWTVAALFQPAGGTAADPDEEAP